MSTALERRWFAAVASLMAVWIALAAIGCVVGLFLQAGAWIRTHASWEAGAALPVARVRQGLLHKGPVYPEIGRPR
jgi:hypothetical protein